MPQKALKLHPSLLIFQHRQDFWPSSYYINSPISPLAAQSLWDEETWVPYFSFHLSLTHPQLNLPLLNCWKNGQNHCEDKYGVFSERIYIATYELIQNSHIHGWNMIDFSFKRTLNCSSRTHNFLVIKWETRRKKNELQFVVNICLLFLNSRWTKKFVNRPAFQLWPERALLSWCLLLLSSHRRNYVGETWELIVIWVVYRRQGRKEFRIVCVCVFCSFVLTACLFKLSYLVKFHFTLGVNPPSLRWFLLPHKMFSEAHNTHKWYVQKLPCIWTWCSVLSCLG